MKYQYHLVLALCLCTLALFAFVPAASAHSLSHQSLRPSGVHVTHASIGTTKHSTTKMHPSDDCGLYLIWGQNTQLALEAQHVSTDSTDGLVDFFQSFGIPNGGVFVNIFESTDGGQTISSATSTSIPNNYRDITFELDANSNPAALICSDWTVSTTQFG